MGFEEKAIECFEENLRRKDEDVVVDKEVGECLLYLAIAYKKRQNFEKTLNYAKRLYDINGPERYFFAFLIC